MTSDSCSPSIAARYGRGGMSIQPKPEHIELNENADASESITTSRQDDVSDVSSLVVQGRVDSRSSGLERRGGKRLSRFIDAFNKGTVRGLRERINSYDNDQTEEEDLELFSCELAGCVWPCSHHEHFSKSPDFIWTSVDYQSVLQDPILCTEIFECEYCQIFIGIGRSWCTCHRNYRRRSAKKSGSCRHEAFHVRFYNGVVTRLEGTWDCWMGSEVLEVSIDDPTTTPLPLRQFDGKYHKDLFAPDCISVFQRWIEECDNTHTGCVPDSHDSRPLRVLECRSADTVRLVDVEPGWRGKYIALSYCWGGVELPSTYGNNLDSRKESIQWRLLPPLYQDLILLAQKLEIEYIWIDSLCIVQDDVKDKDHEVPRMGDIFQNAYFVVIAAAAPSPQKRLFHRMGVSEEEEDRRRMWRNVHGLRSLKFRKRFHSIRFRGVTDTRVWTYQERMLARRCLTFYGTEVVWECRGECHCECSGAQSLLNPRDAFHSQLLPWISSDDTRSAGSSHYASAADAYAFWKKAVRIFSSRKTSYEKDKLPAISALASTVNLATGNEYLAGLWRGDLYAQLLWSCEDNFEEHHGPLAHLGPSWSWISANATANYEEVGVSGNVQRVEVLEASCKLAGGNPFGAVLAGTLLLRGVHCYSEVRIAKATYPENADIQRAFIELYLEDGRFQSSESPHTEFTFLDGYRVSAVDMTIVTPYGEQSVPTVQRVQGDRPAEQATCTGAVRLLWMAEEAVMILAYSRTGIGVFERLGILFGDAVPPMPDLPSSNITIV